MSFIEFESAREKERIREELRSAREELLKRAQKNAEQRAEHQARKVVSGESTWMLPSVSKKIKSLHENDLGERVHRKKEKKTKKSKKEKRHKDKKEEKERLPDCVQEETDTKAKKHKIESAGWPSAEMGHSTRDEWMTAPMMLKTFTKNKESVPTSQRSQELTYDPTTSKLELNKNWKNGGSGLPKFLQPKDDCDVTQRSASKLKSSFSSGNWRKKAENTKIPNDETTESNDSKTTSESETEVEIVKPESVNFLTDQEMNELGAKIIKNEILGNVEVAEKLKKTLEEARANRQQIKDQKKLSILAPSSNKRQAKQDEHILLTTTDKKGDCRPLKRNTDSRRNFSNEQLQFMNDDRYDLKQMFEKEKYAGSYESNAEFVKLAGKRQTTNEDLEDIFTDNIREKDSKAADEKEERNAIRRYEKLSKTLDNCDRCFDTDKIDKQLIISIGKKVYLTLPWHVGLQTGHCLIIPMQHASCCTELDEDTWDEITNFRKSLIQMFAKQKKDVIFFETAKNLHRRPHLVLHCVPSEHFEMAQFYFKKAIQESEYEWSTNKQLIPLKNSSLRSSVPKGLPYFWIDFGIETGFAHVLEEESRFPMNFAQEIIGGMLELDPSRWRKPKKEHNSIAKVKMFADWWKDFDCTT